jgi:NitT/TauT family transport system substrate-binding protein
MMADYGADVYGNAIIVNPKFAADHPDAVKGFLRAFVKSLKSTAKDPAAAVESVVKPTRSPKRMSSLSASTWRCATTS